MPMYGLSKELNILASDMEKIQNKSQRSLDPHWQSPFNRNRSNHEQADKVHQKYIDDNITH